MLPLEGKEQWPMHFLISGRTLPKQTRCSWTPTTLNGAGAGAGAGAGWSAGWRQGHGRVKAQQTQSPPTGFVLLVVQRRPKLMHAVTAASRGHLPRQQLRDGRLATIPSRVLPLRCPHLRGMSSL